jgi:outer membrane lipoprotein-sorting protein
MKRIARIAIAATVLAAIGFIVSWFVIGDGSSNIAFARVAEALDSLRSATFDMTSEVKGEKGQPSRTTTGKGFFLTPSRQRMESFVTHSKERTEVNQGPTSIMIADGQAGKCIMLMPKAKLAMAMDMKKMSEDMKKSAKGAPPDLFEMVRRLVREGSSGTGKQAERLGKQKIDGHEAVGFRTQNPIGDMTLWADPKTARPIRIELIGEMFTNVHMVMNNFRYDMDLDPSLFSLEPPEGYSTQTMNMTMPVEEDLVRTLRTVAEHNKGVFPAKLGMNKEVMESLKAVVKPEMDKLEAKYGVKPKPGELPPPAMMAEAMKTIMPLIQKQMQGIMFYMMLKPENDAHYIGGGVKLGTPDCPILWYKPTDAEKYRVVYADLSVKELAPDEVKKLPQAKSK